MTSVWLKAVHIFALVIWCGGVLVLPALFARRMTVAYGPDLWNLQRFVRYAYRGIVSPAAFVAVLSGMALIFVREVFTAWFAAKLAAVGLLTVLHLRLGYVILNLFDRDAQYRAWRMWASIIYGLAAIVAILWLVLEKPPLGWVSVPDWLREPGGLRTLVKPLLQSLPEIIRPIP